MGCWGVSRVRRVECGAVLLPVSSVAVSSAAVVWHAWAARCRLSGGLATSSLSLRLLYASYNRTHRLLRSQPHVRVVCRRWPRHQPSRPSLQRFTHSSHAPRPALRAQASVSVPELRRLPPIRLRPAVPPVDQVSAPRALHGPAMRLPPRLPQVWRV